MKEVKILEVEKEVLKRIDMICRFACCKYSIKQGSIINIKGSNIAYVSPHIITIKENNYLIFKYCIPTDVQVPIFCLSNQTSICNAPYPLPLPAVKPIFSAVQPIGNMPLTEYPHYRRTLPFRDAAKPMKPYPRYRGPEGHSHNIFASAFYTWPPFYLTASAPTPSSSNLRKGSPSYMPFRPIPFRHNRDLS